MKSVRQRLKEPKRRLKVLGIQLALARSLFLGTRPGDELPGYCHKEDLVNLSLRA